MTEDSKEDASGLDDNADQEEDCGNHEKAKLAPSPERGGWPARDSLATKVVQIDAARMIRMRSRYETLG